MKARRVEVWTDAEDAGGTRAAVLDVVNPGNADRRRTVDGRTELVLELDRQQDGWSEVQHERVVRLIGREGEADEEWRIRQIDDAESEGGEIAGRVECEGVEMDLHQRTDLLERVEENGLSQLHFEVYQRPPSVHMDIILGNLSPYTSGAPAYFQKGTVEPTDPVDMIYDWDTPWSALQELAKVTGTDLVVEWDQAAGHYDVSLLNERGSTAAEPLIKPGRNALRVDRRDKGREQATRVYPQGGGREGERATMVEHAWEINTVDTGTGVITFLTDILIEDGQLVGLYAEKPDGTLTQVTASTAPNQVTVADGSGLAAGDLIQFRRNSAGDELSYLEKPSAVSTYGVKPKVLKRGDIPRVNNLVPNAFLSDWSGGLPVNFASVDTVDGAPTIAQNTDQLFTRYGGSSAHVSGASLGQGIGTAAINVKPTKERPYFTVQIALWVVSGSVRLELDDLTNGKTWPPAEAADAAVTDERGVWIERLGVSPGEDFEAAGTQQFQVRAIAAEDGTEFYLDAVMLTQTAAGVETFYDERGSNRLWLAANRELQLRAEPLSEWDVQSLDLNALDASKWPDEEFVLGGTVRLVQRQLGIDVKTRIRGIRDNPFIEAAGRLELGTELDNLTRTLAEPRRRSRSAREDRRPELFRPADVTNFAGTWKAVLRLTWDHVPGAARYEIREQGTGATPEERWDNGTTFAVQDLNQFEDSEPDLKTLNLTIKGVSATGRVSRNPTELDNLRPEGKEEQCENYLEAEPDPGEEYCSEVSTGDPVLVQRYTGRTLADMGLAPGDPVGIGVLMKVSTGVTAGQYVAQSLIDTYGHVAGEQIETWPNNEGRAPDLVVAPDEGANQADAKLIDGDPNGEAHLSSWDDSRAKLHTGMMAEPFHQTGFTAIFVWRADSIQNRYPMGVSDVSDDGTKVRFRFRVDAFGDFRFGMRDAGGTFSEVNTNFPVGDDTWRVGILHRDPGSGAQDNHGEVYDGTGLLQRATINADIPTTGAAFGVFQDPAQNMDAATARIRIAEARFYGSGLTAAERLAEVNELVSRYAL